MMHVQSYCFNNVNLLVFDVLVDVVVVVVIKS